MELPENMRTAWDHAEFKDLSREGIWRVEDVFWMLFGENGYVSIKSAKASPIYSHDHRISSLLVDMKIAILTGRFGEFDRNNVESSLLFCSAHPLKFIDWLNEKGIMDEARDWGYSTHPLFVEIIESWESRRAEEEMAKHPLDYILDYQRTAKFDVWSLKRLRRLLFHQGYAWEYFSGRYHKYDPGMEEYMRIVDQDVAQGLAIGDRITGPKGTNGIGEPLYSALEILRELQFKDYPISDELIDAKERRDWATTETLLRQLHDGMNEYIENGGRPVASLNPGQEKQAQLEPEPSPQKEIEPVKPGVVPPENSVSGAVDADIEALVRTLKFCYYEPYVFISKAGERPTPFTLDSIGFNKPAGITARDFISILNEAHGPLYDFGASHSYLSSDGRNLKNLSSDGTYEPQEKNEARESRASTGFSEVPQKIENPEYRTRKSRLEDINEKICQFIEKIYGISLGDGFKLYEKVSGKKGMYRFKFQTRKNTPLDPKAYSSMTREETLRELKILSLSVKTENAEVNEIDTDKYLNLCKQALDQGISEAEIENLINPRKDPRINP